MYAMPSGLQPLSKGVPQVSIVGELLFLKYENEIRNANETSQYSLHADDIALYNTIQIQSMDPSI